MDFKKIMLVIFIVANIFNFSFANNKQNYPYLKPCIHIFTNFNSAFKGIDKTQGFQITRAHLGLKTYFDENFTGVIYYDATNPNDSGKLDRTGYLKQAYLNYQSNGFSFRIGMIPLKQIAFLEDFWGHRFVYKSFQEQYGFGSYYDIGAVAEYQIISDLSFDLSLMNGEGLFANQHDKTYKGGIGLTYSFWKSFYFREYIDYTKKYHSEYTISTFLGYKYKDKFSIGGDYDIKNNYNYKINQNLYGLSLYSTYYFTKQYDVFLRYDKLYSKGIDDEKLNTEKNGQKIIAGIEYIPIKYVRISANYQDWIADKGSLQDLQQIYLDFEIKY